MPNTHVTKNYFTDNGNELVISFDGSDYRLTRQ